MASSAFFFQNEVRQVFSGFFLELCGEIGAAHIKFPGHILHPDRLGEMILNVVCHGNRKLSKPNDILINSTGAGTAGRIAQIEQVPCATTVDGHMILIRSNGKVTQKFLGYALKAHQWEVLQLDEGSTGQTELNRDRLLDEIMIN